MTQYRTVPTYDQPLSQSNATAQPWYRFFQALQLGTPPGAEVTVTPTGSPSTFTATQGGRLLVAGGTVSSIQFKRTASYATGQTSGFIPLSVGDAAVITYSAAPTLTFIPQ